MRRHANWVVSVVAAATVFAPSLEAGERGRFRLPWNRTKETVTEAPAAKEMAPRKVPANAPVIGSRRFSIEYAVRDLFGGGKSLSKVELFLSKDMGLTWTKYGIDPDVQSPFVVTVSGDGAYGFALVTTDVVGNKERDPFPGMLPDRVIVVDTQAPTGKFISPVRREVMGDEGIEIAWETADAHLNAEGGVTLQFSSNEGRTWRTIPTVTPLPAKGNLTVRPKRRRAPSYSFRMIVKDRAGNEATVVAPGVILTDNVAPTIALTGPEKPGANGVDLTYEAFDNEGGSGLEWVELWVTTDEGTSWKRYGRDDDQASPVRYENKSGAGHVGFALQAADKVGNESPAPKPGEKPRLAFVFDAAGPTVRLTVGKGDRQFAGGAKVDVEWVAEDANPAAQGVKIEFSADGRRTWELVAENQAFQGSTAWLLPKDSERNLNNCVMRIQAMDSLGNATTEYSAPFSILNVAPKPVLKEVNPLPEKGSEPAVTAPTPMLPPMKSVKPAGPHPSAAMSDDDDRLEIIGQKAILQEREEKARKERLEIERKRQESIAKAQKAAEVEAARRLAEDEAKRKAEAEARARAEAEKRARRDTEEAERRRREELETQKRREDEARRKAAEAAAREKAEAEARLAKVRADAQLVADRKAREREAEAKTVPPKPMVKVPSAQESRSAEEARSRREAELRRIAEEQARAALAETTGLGKTPEPSQMVKPASAAAGVMQLVRQGELALEEGRVKQAELYALEALDKDGNTLAAHVLLGKVRGSQQRYEEALESAEKAISLNDKFEPAYLVIGDMSFALYKKTQGRLKELVEVQGAPQDITRTREKLTRFYRNTVASYREVTKMNKGSKEAYDRLGEVYYYRARYAEDDAARQSAYWDSIEAFKAGSEIGQMTYKEAFRIGIIHYRRKEFDSAVRYFKRGLEVCPADRKPKECLWYLSESYEVQGRLDDALVFWRQTSKAYDPQKESDVRYHRRAVKKIREIENKLMQ